MAHGRPGKIVASAAFLMLLFGDASVAVAADADEVSPGTPGAAVEALLAHVPEGHRDACRPDLTNFWPEPIVGSVRMSVHCELDDGLEVSYTQFTSTEALTDRYQQWLELLPDVHGVSDCGGSIPEEGSYTIGGESAGRLLCYKEYDFASLHWTHEATNIYGEASREGAPKALRAWWKAESGPLETAAESPKTGLGAALDALLMQVPEGHRATCVPFHGDHAADGLLASLRCEVSPELVVYYKRLDSLEALEATYQSDLDARQITGSNGDCSQALPGEGSYDIGREPAGRLLCSDWLRPGTILFTWTHEPTLIMATAFLEGGQGDLLEWWYEESGPVG